MPKCLAENSTCVCIGSICQVMAALPCGAAPLGARKRHYALVRIQFLGTGTPLGLDGLHQACLLVTTDDGSNLLVDCGMTALASLGRAGLGPDHIDGVLISHLHGDHFGGLAPLLLDASMRSRERPLTVAGP